MSENDETEQPAIKLLTLLLVNYCKRQPFGRLMSYAYIEGIIQVHPRNTKEGRAIMRRALRDLFMDGYIYQVKPGSGIYMSGFLVLKNLKGQ
jgi:hypothetical protein